MFQGVLVVCARCRGSPAPTDPAGGPAAPPRPRVHDVDHERGQVAADTLRAVEGGVGERAHLVRELRVVELRLPHQAERARHAHHGELRRQEEHGQRGRAVAARQRGPPPPALHGGRDHERQRADHQPGPLPLEQGDAAPALGEPPRGTGDEQVVQGHEERHGEVEHGDDRHRRDGEVPAHVEVHGQRLEARLHGYFTDLPYPYPDTYPILRYPDTPSIPYRQSIGKYEEKNK